jgi:predicted ATPase
VLVDFDGALRASGETRPSVPVSVTPYISPEQTGRVSRTIDYRTDFYSLGATLYEVLTGRPPFKSDDSLEIIHSHLAKNPAAPSLLDQRIPEQISRIVLRLMAKAPEDRYQSTTGVAHDVDVCERQWIASQAVAPFELGQRDVPERFLMSRKLYGRDRETRQLLTAFEEAHGGITSLLLVSGYSGIGKTSLIHDLYKPIVRQRGYFISGKFDQIVRNIPYGALIQSFRGLVWQLLTETEERLAAWRGRVERALGANGGVLAEVIPEIELIIGKQEPPPPLGPTEAQNRFRYVLQSFVAVVASKDHPLVLFLDDLQWVDAATLEVLDTLLTAPEIRHLLLIGAYRDNEVDAGHRLTVAVQRVALAGARVHRVPLGPLDPPDLTRFLRDSFRSDQDDVEEVAALVHKKTGGNPFFVIQFLQALELDHLIGFDRAQGRWTFQLDAIGRAGLTDNIIDLMSSKIRRLSAEGQEALTHAACIGNTFDWNSFSVTTRQGQDQAAAGLSEALQAGLIHMTGAAAGAPSRGPVYAFLHDRVQQAAYALIPNERKKPVHLDVGRLLLAQSHGEAPDDRLFEIANHLNIGGDLITDESERVQVARLNLAAGRKAKMSAAYQAAAGYLEAGIALVGDSGWHAHYELMFALHLEAAECHYLAGTFEPAEEYFALLQARAETRLDVGQVLSLRIVLYENQSRWSEAVACGREALALFGIVLPDSDAEKQAALDREIETAERALAGRPIAALVDLPVMTDPDTRMVMRLLTSLWAPAYISGDQVLARLISATMVRLSLAHGNTEDSAYGYVTHAITVGPIRRDYRSAYEWGQLALSVNERLEDPKRRAKIHQQFQAHVSLWRRPFAMCIPHAREARRIGIETGDFTYAGYGAMSEAWPALAISRNLDQFVREYSPTLDFLERLKMIDFHAAHRVVLNWARALQGLTAAPLSLSDETFDDQGFIARYEGRNAFFLTFLFTARLQLAVLVEEYDQALAAARRAREGALAGTIWPVLIDFWSGLAIAAVYPDVPAEMQHVHRQELAAAERSLAELAENCPENYRCFWLLLSAAIARVDGHLTEATRLCEEALAYARQTASVQHEALANELTARVWLARDRPAIAAAFMADAHRCYAAWGATAKVADLDKRYGSLIADKARPDLPAGGHETTAIAAAAPALDMATVIKLAHTVGVHMEIGGLLEQLMRLALENAGADRSAFLLERDGQLVVAATATADSGDVRVGSYVPLDETEGLARSVIRYVHRTGQDVVVDTAASDERFGADPYIRTGTTKSLLGVPVGRPERPSGVLYLENSLTTHAFSATRTEMMRILAAQTAISLENARLYEQMKSEVERRTAAEHALRDALGELQLLKERLEAENVYLQEEIRTQHNFNEIVGNCPMLLDALHKVERVAPTESTVLIVGETGSGKELFARAVHSRSRRSDRPLVKVNCGAIAPGLVESELFGHVKGAFTGAIEKRTGRFEVANGGTIFLDEVGELPLEAQVKLLRVLQEQEFEPVGTSRTIRVSVRVIAATNRNLEQAVKDGRFRADLLYRLNVFPIDVPPLRQRRADIELLAGFFITGLARKLGKPVQGFSVRSMQRMLDYSWPGNVRELQNVVERAAILAKGPVVEIDEVLIGGEPTVQTASAPSSGRETLDDAQRAHILRVLAATDGVVEGAKGAAAVLGIHANTLRSRMKKLGITASRGKSA